MAINTLEAMLEQVDEESPNPATIELLNELARAHYVQGDFASATDYADKVLRHAERLNLVPLVLDALITRGTSVAFEGRLREGQIMLTGAVTLAEDEGHAVQQARAYVNLAEFLRTVKPYQALVAGRRGLELARRVGLREWEYYLAANVVKAAFPTGEWDWANSTLSELFEEGIPDGVDPEALCVAATLAAFRGDLESQEAAWDKAREMSVETTDPQVVAQLRESEAWIAIAEGRVSEAHQSAGAAVSADPNGSAAIVGTSLPRGQVSGLEMQRE